MMYDSLTTMATLRGVRKRLSKRSILLWAGFFSVTAHLIIVGLLQDIKTSRNSQAASRKPTKVKVNYLKPILKKEVAKQTDDSVKRIIETPQTKTAPPKEAKYLGRQNHRAKVETKVKRQNHKQAKGLAAGKKSLRTQVRNNKRLGGTPNIRKKVIPRTKFGRTLRKPVTYQQLLANSAHIISNPTGGYKEYIDDKLTIGEAIDLNTHEYRYVGYFSALRQAIELVWTYPASAARRGIRGKVKIRFTIRQNGAAHEIGILKSSGHELLDNAIVKAIKLASPFAPLPKGIQKRALTVQGTFTYVLSNYFRSH